MKSLLAFSRNRNSGLRELSQNNIYTVSFSEDLIMLQSLVKISQSIVAELVPANDLYLDKKGFSWELIGYTENSLAFNFNFDHPKYISVGGTDTMKITFSNSEAYMSP